MPDAGVFSLSDDAGALIQPSATAICHHRPSSAPVTWRSGQRPERLSEDRLPPGTPRRGGFYATTTSGRQLLDVLAITTPIFLLVALGYLAVASHLVSREHIRGLGRFVINFALPALIVRALVQEPLTEVFNAHYLLAYGLGSLLTFMAGFWRVRFIKRRPLDHAALQAMGMATSNSGFIGYPIAMMVAGPAAGVALALCMLIENLLMIPLALALAEAGSRNNGSVIKTISTTAARLVRNPVIIAITSGALLSFVELSLPAPLFKAIDMLADASAPVALFVLGGTLCGLKIGSLYRDAGRITLAKLILHPLLVLLFFQLFPVDNEALMVAALVIAASPMLSVYPIFGVRFSLDGLCAAALLAATVASFFTISAALWLLGGGF